MFARIMPELVYVCDEAACILQCAGHTFLTYDQYTFVNHIQAAMTKAIMALTAQHGSGCQHNNVQSLNTQS